MHRALNEHSFRMALNAVARKTRVLNVDPSPAPKRDLIRRAAIDVFAERGFFNSQVADVARAAGVAAGTVYLYFKSKDDLLVSIFERSMRDGLAAGRAAVADLDDDPRERLRRLAHGHLERLGRDRNLAIVFQVELRQSTKFMERFSATLLRDYLGLIRSAIADGQRAGLFRSDIKPTIAAKALFGALDEMATNWILSRRRYSLEADADAVVDLFINGARSRS
jgi:TetR/AcrR family transcriptional regulator, fatty acid metabolism regulator protein